MHEHDIDQSGPQRRRAERSPDKAESALAWASTLGNRAVQRLLKGTVQRDGAGEAAVDETVARAIDAKRGTGKPLDSDARAQLETTMGEDFSDVRVHDDPEAHSLNRAVSAEAFTTGSDVFFNSGKYDPGSSPGRKLLAHELTHVVQQRGAAPTQELTVSDPGDASETEAHAVAESVASAAPASAGAGVARQEEEELQMSPLDRQGPEEEEEPLQG